MSTVKFLVINAGSLLTFAGPDKPRTGAEMRSVGRIPDGAILIQDGTIAVAGLRDVVMRHPEAEKARVIDAGGRLVMPGFVDSHAHPVFAAPRLKDFEMRLQGKNYQETAAAGGGILSSVAAVRAATEASLMDGLAHAASRFLECGTTTLEAKSGYGLELEAELKMLRAIRKAGEMTALEIIPTFLGAHAFPVEFKEKPADYVEKICSEMIPAVAREELARFVDVFCDKGYFTQADAERILKAGIQAGLSAKIHSEQLSRCGGAAVAARVKATSADHLDCSVSEDWKALRDSGVVATLLPGVSCFLNVAYPSARSMIEAGLAVALATDFNPGTSPCWNMQMIVSLACSQMKMAPEEALIAATINGAYALGLGKTHGSIEKGKQADILILNAEDYREIPYYFGGNLVSLVMKKGTVVHTTFNLRP